MPRLAIVVAVAATGLLTPCLAAAQGAVPGCFRPDQALVRIDRGTRACQPGEVRVLLRLPQAQVSLPLQPPAAARQAMPHRAADPGAALADANAATRASAQLDFARTGTAADLNVPAQRTLAVVGSAFSPIR